MHAHHAGSSDPLIFISAAEQSADSHGAALIRAFLEKQPGARFVGVAGPKMAAAGCERIFDMTPHAAMLASAARAAWQGIRMLQASERHLRRYPFSAAVLIDSPTLHLPLAARAHGLGVPVMYYIAPQMWAWGRYRIHKLRNHVDKVAVILPFEEEFFRGQGVDARFVGHPVAETVAARPIDASVVARLRSGGSPLVALLPGSRKHVVDSVLPGQLEVARRIREVLPRAAFAVSIANPVVASHVDRVLASGGPSIRGYAGCYAEVVHAADLVLVASGTSALEVAFHRRPMIVMYKVSRLFYHAVGRWMIRTPYLSLPNILAGREIVPEFMPYYDSTAPIAEQALALLTTPELRETMLSELGQAVEPLRQGGASIRAAQMLQDITTSGNLD